MFGTGAETCSNVNSEFNLNNGGGYTFQVGNGFKGMIKDFHLLDWPKSDYEFSTVIQTAGCTAWNGVACTHCPVSTGQCLSTCEKEEYGTTCLTCLQPNCWTCYGPTYDQ